MRSCARNRWHLFQTDRFGRMFCGEPGWSFHVDIEWQPRDLWVGAYFEREQTHIADGYTPQGRVITHLETTHVRLWLCLIPCVPIRIAAWNDKDVPF